MFDSITPEQEAKIKEEITLYEASVNTLVVNSKEDYDLGAEYLLGLKKRIDRVKSLRDGILKPIKTAIKEAENKFKFYLTPFEEMEGQVRQKMTVYANQQYQIEQEAARAKEAQARKEREAAAAEAAKNAKPNAPAPEIQAPEPVEAAKKPESVQTEAGAVHTRKRWTFELVNIAEVPAEYLMVDTVKLNAQIKAGVREIPGVKIFETIDLNTRS